MHTKTNLLCLVILTQGVLTANLGCKSETLPGRAVGPADAAAPALPERQVPREEATRVLLCPDSSSPDSVSHYYAVDRMTRKLHRFPSLAEYAGLGSVSSCEEAVAYARAYDEYSAKHPDFEDQPDPKASGNSSDVEKGGVLPRLKIVDGTKEEGADLITDWDGHNSDLSSKKVLGPIVRLTQVSFWANGKEAHFKNAAGDNINEFCEPAGSCTGTFLNKNWILTAAHCMQNVAKISARRTSPAGPKSPFCLEGDAGQPYDPNLNEGSSRKGVASWIISWPSSSIAMPGATLDTNAPLDTDDGIGVELYQFPHPNFDPSDDDLRNRPDLALLYLPSWGETVGYLPPNPSAGSAVYIKATTGTYPPDTTNFLIAGWGINPNRPGVSALFYANVLKPAYFPDLFCLLGGIVKLYGDGDSRIGVCGGDSGGPFYVKRALPNRAPEIIQYAVASMVSDGDVRRCVVPGESSMWVRLEQDRYVIGWINETLASVRDQIYGVPEGTYNQCVVDTDLSAGTRYKCFGEPCGAKDANLIDYPACPPEKTCVGDGESLASQGHKCHVCPPSNFPDGSCGCVVGECMWDPAKIKKTD